MEVHWTIDGDSILLGLRAPARGWVAIGRDRTTPTMGVEDIILGYIGGKELFL